MMDGWAAALRDLFGPSLSQLFGLDQVSSGEEFEELLGELTTWLQLISLNRRFARMTSGTDAGEDDFVVRFNQALTHAETRGQRLEEALDLTLYEHFGPARFDASTATSAYRQLLLALGGKKPPARMICATTNYDRSIELALKAIYRTEIRTGFRYDGINRAVLSAKGLGQYRAVPSVLYLHGAVGWYQSPSGEIVAHPASEDFRPEIGRPAVLYPSHKKIVENSAVKDIWTEFDNALAKATHVLVLGHGLADSHLVRRLRALSKPLMVMTHTKQDIAKLEEMLPNAHRTRVDFGPEVNLHTRTLREWIKGKDETRKRATAQATKTLNGLPSVDRVPVRR